MDVSYFTLPSGDVPGCEDIEMDASVILVLLRTHS